MQRTMTHLRSSRAWAVTIMSSIRSVQTKPNNIYPTSLCEQVSCAIIGPATVDEMIRMNVSTSTCNVEVRAAPQPILHADAVSHEGTVSFTTCRVGLSISRAVRYVTEAGARTGPRNTGGATNMRPAARDGGVHAKSAGSRHTRAAAPSCGGRRPPRVSRTQPTRVCASPPLHPTVGPHTHTERSFKTKIIGTFSCKIFFYSSDT